MKILASNLIAALKSNPLALALVVINVVFLVGLIMAAGRKDALLADLIRACVQAK